MIIGGMLAAPILLCAQTIFPAYATYKAVVANEAEGMARWLQYWLVIAALSLVDGILDMVGAYLPFYLECKIAFVFWLSLDKFQGSTFLFKKYIEPLLSDKTEAIDEQIDFLTTRVKNFKVEDVRTLVNWLSSKDMKAVINTVSAAAAKKAAVAGEAISKASVPEQADKPQEPEEIAEVVEPDEAEEPKKAK